MQPEAPQPQLAAQEILNAPSPQGGERIPELPSLETTGVEQGAADRREQLAEASAVASDMATTQVPQQAAVVADDAAATAAPIVTPTSPVVAADEDLIEKEWVDKAKEIISATQDDPHARTNQVNQLQRDYLMKRYGKDVAAG